MNAPPAMRDLTAGTRIRHLAWLVAGTVRVAGGITSVHWDGLLADDEISTEGPVFPCDIEIVEAA